jgi:hypothetical protein
MWMVTHFFECRVIEHAREKRHECHDDGKGRNCTEKIGEYGTQHSGYSDHYALRCECKGGQLAKVSLSDALISANGRYPTYSGVVGSVGLDWLLDCDGASSHAPRLMAA